jgi:hypothetical protein
VNFDLTETEPLDQLSVRRGRQIVPIVAKLAVDATEKILECHRIYVDETPSIREEDGFQWSMSSDECEDLTSRLESFYLTLLSRRGLIVLGKD